MQNVEVQRKAFRAAVCVVTEAAGIKSGIILARVGDEKQYQSPLSASK